MRAAWAMAVALALGASVAWGQPATTAPTAATQSPPAPVGEDSPTWAFSASVYGYILADEPNYVQPTVTADRGWLHLESRYNYEDLKTGSAWLGFNFSGGEALAWELTPMVGGVFGSTDGVAPGYRASLTWRTVNFYSEGEYVFASDSSGSFFYSWSELTVAPVEWFRAGFVGQRTRVYKSEREVSPGILVGFSRRSWDIAAFLFNPDDSKPTVVFAATVGF